MKRAFAIAIVVVLALGMVGMLFPALLASQGTTGSVDYTTSTGQTGSSLPLGQ